MLLRKLVSYRGVALSLVSLRMLHKSDFLKEKNETRGRYEYM